MRLAAAHGGNNDAAGAVRAYLEAYDAPGFSYDMLTGAIRGNLRSSSGLQGEEALGIIAEIRKKEPENRRAALIHAIITETKGNAWIARNQKEQGARLVEKSLAEFQKLFDSASAGAEGSAERNFLLRKMAESHLGREEYEKARKLYEDALKIQENDVQSLNNRAFVIVDHFDDPKGALPYAKKAFGFMPQNPSVTDTYGWCLALVGDLDNGIARLRDAVEGIPQSAEVHYHLAFALFNRSELGGDDAEQDRRDAEAECKKAHQLLLQSGAAPNDDLLGQVIALGEKMDLRLKRTRAD
jgi:tetratricopeptide (TPR) repeat protein